MPSNSSSLPYERATSGDRAIAEMQRVLQRFGCQNFGTMMDWERRCLIVQFKYRGVSVVIEASTAGYAAAWLKAHPPSYRRNARSRVDQEREAERIASLAVYSIVRDWVKGQITAIECGILSFEGAFLGQILLGSGQTALAYATSNHLLPSGEAEAGA